MADNTSNGSPRAKAWLRFRSNRLGLVASAFVILCAIVSLFAYFIIPDHTPHANTQLLELSTQKPGFEVDVLLLPKASQERESGFIRKMFYGQPSPYRQLPFDSIGVLRDSTIAYLFNPEHDGPAETLLISNSEIAPGHQFSTDSEAKAYITDKCVLHRRFVLGTDQFGRDFLSRLVLGTRVSFSVGFIAVLMSLLIGIVIGSIGGFFRGWVDNVAVWLINVVWSIPTLLMVIAITFALGKGYVQVFIAVGLTMWVEVARIVRGQILSIRETTYIEACKALGFGRFRTIFRHILPNILNPIIVISASNFASAILLEAGLSFLGIGVQPPLASWGSMIKENYAYIILDAPYLAILPGLAIMLLVLAFMLVGNALREALEVKN